MFVINRSTALHNQPFRQIYFPTLGSVWYQWVVKSLIYLKHTVLTVSTEARFKCSVCEGQPIRKRVGSRRGLGYKWVERFVFDEVRSCILECESCKAIVEKSNNKNMELEMNISCVQILVLRRHQVHTAPVLLIPILILLTYECSLCKEEQIMIYETNHHQFAHS